MGIKPICIIPARKGSKRLPRKNLLLYRNKPLVKIAVENPINSDLFESVILNSDDEDIIKLFKDQSNLEISTRPNSLTLDDVRADEVIRWEITNRHLSADTIVCCLLPTTPGLNIKEVAFALEFLPSNAPIFGVTKSRDSVFRAFHVDSGKNLKPLFPEKLNLQSQDYQDTFVDAGAFYLARAQVWLNNYSITASVFSKGWILDPNANIDINYLSDWELFKALNPE
jgi:N-acylneuraminate cytidylyltransferase